MHRGTNAGAKNTEVLREVEHNRYVLLVDGERAGVANYVEHGDTIVFPHTEISPARRGNGLGSVLVRGALDDVRRRTRAAVVPLCWFVDAWIDVHPDYEDLLTARP